MPTPARMDELLAQFYNGAEQELDVEYIGRFRVNGAMILRVPEPGLESQWARSVVPIDYLPLYGLKFGEPELAGGLFESAPFPRYDPSGPQYEWMNPPTAPEPVYELCTDNCGAQFWVSAAGIVYGHSLDNTMQSIGPLSSLVDYAIDLAFEGTTWYEKINTPEITDRYGLHPINTMD